MSVSKSVKEWFDNVRILVYFTRISKVHTSLSRIRKFCDMIINVGLCWLDFSFGFLTLRYILLDRLHIRLMMRVFCRFDRQLVKLRLNLTFHSMMRLPNCWNLFNFWTLRDSNVLNISLSNANIMLRCN